MRDQRKVTTVMKRAVVSRERSDQQRG